MGQYITCMGVISGAEDCSSMYLKWSASTCSFARVYLTGYSTELPLYLYVVNITLCVMVKHDFNLYHSPRLFCRSPACTELPAMDTEGPVLPPVLHPVPMSPVQQQSPVPAPTEQQQSPVPAPTEQQQSPVPAPTEQQQSPVPAPTEQLAR